MHVSFLIRNITYEIQGYEKLKQLFLKFFFRATPVAYGRSQAWVQIGAAAGSLHHSHSSTESKPHL